MTHARWIAWWSLMVSAVAACAPEYPPPIYRCDREPPCPTGFVCVASVCVRDCDAADACPQGCDAACPDGR